MPSNRVTILTVAVAASAGMAISYAFVRPASQTNSAAERPPATIEHVEGSEVSRVTLTARAAERLDIRTEQIREERVDRWRVLRGEVVAMAGPRPGSPLWVVDAAPPAAAMDALWVRVHRDLGVEKIGMEQLASAVIELRDNDDDGDDDGEPTLAGWLELMAELVDDEDGVTKGKLATACTRTMVAASEASAHEWLYYVVKEPERLKVRPSPGQAVLVRVPLGRPEASPKVVPYSAIIYDTVGETWVFANPEPLVFVRQKVSVDFISADLAVLLDGPPLGTQVVTVGAAELLGAEFEIGH